MTTAHHRRRLGVNVDHVATIRQARGTRYPDPVEAAFLAESAGCDQITVHLREDRRHIQDRDVRVLRDTVRTRLNLEMAVTPEMIAFARQLRPDMVTLVPEKREERTTEGGLDVVRAADTIRRATETLAEADILVSLFVDPTEQAIEAARSAAAPMIELHTGDFANAPEAQRPLHVRAIRHAAELGTAAGLVVAAGHGLDTRNVVDLTPIPQIVEYNIGHSIVARAVLIGFDAAVREMIEALRPPA